MKVVTVVGARPQFVKAAAVSPVLRAKATEVLVHTGQHYDRNMSDVFFEELSLPEPDYNLGVGSGSHGQQTAHMLEMLETVLLKERPDWVLVYGDTNSTLAAALAAAKIHIPVAHVEAGLRSFNRSMPEEINRIVTDHVSEVLFAPTQNARKNLDAEGLAGRTVVTGDVMADTLFRIRPRLGEKAGLLLEWGVEPGEYVLLTLHRAGNVDDPVRLREILAGLKDLDTAVLFPIHPRTMSRIREFGLSELIAQPPFRVVPPAAYAEMLMAQENARVVVTDSGGVQKEAFLLSVPCVTLRNETEWVETVESGWNVLVSDDMRQIAAVVQTPRPRAHPNVFGSGRAADAVVECLLQRAGLESAFVENAERGPGQI